MRTTTNAGLTVWDLSADLFDHDDLAANWDNIDGYFVGFDSGSKLVKQLHHVSAVPGSGNAGETIMLTAANGSYAAYTILKHNGTRWLPLTYEILPTVPGSNNFAGRLVLLSAADSGFGAYELIRYDGSAWDSVGLLSHVNEGSYPKISGGTTASDLYVSASNRGLVLKDRTTNTRYRLYIDNGTLGFESAE